MPNQASNQVFSNIIGHKRSIGRVNKYETDLLRCPGLVHWPVLLQKYEPDFLRISQVGFIFNLFSSPMFVNEQSEWQTHWKSQHI